MIGFSSLYLLSALGVEGEPNDMVYVVGGTGCASAVIAILFGSFALSRTHDEHRQSDIAPYQKSTRKLSFGEANDAAIFGGLI